eukprot:scaffold198130_cov45-Prasinocladus_malaysianus.AAC.2
MRSAPNKMRPVPRFRPNMFGNRSPSSEPDQPESLRPLNALELFHLEYALWRQCTSNRLPKRSGILMLHGIEHLSNSE